MADTPRSQATVLEVPVTIQGSKNVNGTDQRELFTETTQTTLVFANGAVVKLSAKLAPGQCVFLRNDLSEKEILCKVLESRQAGQAGYTDLEFTSYDPTFWNVQPKPPTAAPKLTAQERLEAAANNPIATSSAESGAPSDAQKSEAQRKIDEAVKNLAGTSNGKSSVPSGEEPSAQAEVPDETGTNLSWEKMMETSEDERPSVPPSWKSTAPESGEMPASVLAPAASSGPATTLVASAVPIVLEAPHESLSHLQSHEPSAGSTVPASAEILTNDSAPASPGSSATLVASAAPIVLEAPHESLTHLQKHEPTDEELDWNDAKEAEMLAALATMEAGSKSNREPPAEDTDAAEQEAAAQAKQERRKKLSNPAKEAAALSAPAAPTRKLQGFTAGKNPVAIGIAAALLLTAVLGLAWRMKSVFSGQSNVRPAAASAQPKTPAQPAAAPSPQTPASAAATSTTAAQKPGATTTAATPAPKPASTGLLSKADQEVLGLTTHRKPNGEGDSPARIVSQAAPALPVWAQGTEMDHVVTLDALLDEKGNLVETKPISGPRLLQAEAQRAVAIWVFEPAKKGGQPTSSHIVLTVQFQK
ncbi:MAG TPA: energy transducer TonB [Candidatus Acidoferrales bacterium]|nr:energy transducer TonB [Candidatus Acidoferrales bacterium]